MFNRELAPENFIYALLLGQLHVKGLDRGVIVVKQFAGHFGRPNAGRHVDIQGAFLAGNQGAEGGLVLLFLAVEQNTHILVLS